MQGHTSTSASRKGAPPPGLSLRPHSRCPAVLLVAQMDRETARTEADLV